MDRKLIGGAIALLIIQISLLISDVDIYPGSSESLGISQANDIGVIIKKKQSVKKRSQGSVVWENSENADRLENFDSILTLENSSVQIQLKNDINIELQENTLIVIEPQDASANDALRIRFSRGHIRSQAGTKKVEMTNKEWQLSTTPGTSLSLKGLDNEQLEVEVTTGTVNIQNTNLANENIKIETGNRLSLSQNKIEKIEKISSTLKLSLKDEERIYSHIFPVQYFVRWEGSAQKIRVVDAKGNINYYDTLPGEHSKILSFSEGTHYLSINGEDSISKEVILRAIAAPKIRYTSPLTRERFLIEDSILFSWLPLEASVKYEVELTNEDTERMIIPSLNTQAKAQATIAGQIQMRVFGEDELGFRIPPHYSQTLFILRDALAPPKLQSPDVRAPASPADKKIIAPKNAKDKSAFNWDWLQFFIRTAHAEDLPAQAAPALAAASASPSSSARYVVFSWYPVPGADFYNIEICTEPDFLHPEVITKSEKEVFQWADFTPRPYYWRVAAGSNSGRMGLFSETAMLDLTDVNKQKSGEIAPGVKLITPKEIIIKPRVREPEAPVATLEPEGIETQVQHKPNIWSFYSSVDLHYLNYSLDKEFSASLSGFANLALSGGARVETENRDHYLYSLHYAQAKWMPEDKSILAFQDELVTHSYSLSGLYEKQGRDFGYGLRIESQPILKRVALERLSKGDVIMAGGAISYNTIIADRINLFSEGGLLFGDSIFSVLGENTINYDIKFKDWKPYIGGDFNFKLFFGSDSMSGFYLTTGLHLGLNW